MPRIIITEPDKTPQPYRLKADRIATKIGRGSDNDVVISAPSASTYHCKMRRVEGGFTLEDNNSTNGIKYQDTRYSIIDLKDGMIVQIGDDIDMEFTLTDEEIELLAQEDFTPQQRGSFPKQSKKSASNGDPDIQVDLEAIELGAAAPKRNESSSENDEDDPDDADETKPKLKAGNANPARNAFNNRSLASFKSASSGSSILLFIILAILCFGVGMTLRHYQDHNTFIFSK